MHGGCCLLGRAGSLGSESSRPQTILSPGPEHMACGERLGERPLLTLMNPLSCKVSFPVHLLDALTVSVQSHLFSGF
jgi:hypothetical protein